MSELKPCPFCGSSDIESIEWIDGDGNYGPKCLGCCATALSANAWNTRASPWISTIQKLPPVSHDEILIKAGSVKRLARYLANKNGGYSFYNFADEEIKYPVTHWMPLPEPPEQAND